MKQFITADEIEYNPDDFELPVKYTITKISDVFIITGLDTRMYSVDNKCVVDCPPEAYYPNTLRHHGIYSHNSNHRFLVQLPRGDIYTPNDFYPVFTDLGVAVEFRNVLYKYNKHKYKNILQNEIPIYYFDAMNDKLDNKDLLEYSDRVSFIKGKAIGRVCDAPLDIGNHEFYDNGIWLHPEGKNTGIIDSPDKYYHKDVYKIGDKIYQADFLAIDRKEDFIPRGLLAEFLSKNQHVTKVREGKCLFIDNLVNDFIKFIRDYSGCRILAEKAYKIQDMLRDGALSNKMITYQLNLGISNIVNDNTSFMLLENDNRDNNDGFYLAPNRMSSYLKPVFPTKGSKNKSIGNVFEVSESINLSNTVAILTSMVIDEIALYEKPNSPLFISLEELTKKIIHFTNEFKDESNPLFEKVDVFNKLLKSGKVNFGVVYNCVSDYLTFNRSTVKRLGNDGKCYLLSNTYRDNASVYFVKDELILGKIYTDKDVVKLDDNKQYVVIPESLIANTLLNTNGDNSNVVSGYNYSALNAVFDKEALLDHYHDIVSEITKHDLILNRGVSLELEKIHLSDVSSDVRTNGGWGKLYKEVSGKELNESGFGTVKICDGLYGIKDGLFNIYEHSNKEYGINEF